MQAAVEKPLRKKGREEFSIASQVSTLRAMARKDVAGENEMERKIVARLTELRNGANPTGAELAKQGTLSPAQIRMLKGIFSDYREIKRQLTQGPMTEEEKRRIRVAAEDEMEKEIRGILTPEEYRDYLHYFTDAAGIIRDRFGHAGLSKEQIQGAIEIEHRYLDQWKRLPLDGPGSRLVAYEATDLVNELRQFLGDEAYDRALAGSSTDYETLRKTLGDRLTATDRLDIVLGSMRTAAALGILLQSSTISQEAKSATAAEMMAQLDGVVRSKIGADNLKSILDVNGLPDYLQAQRLEEKIQSGAPRG